MTLRKQALVGAIALALGMAANTASAETGRYIIQFKDGKGASARAAINRAGGKMKRDLSRHNAAAFELPAQAVNGLRHNPNVEYIEVDEKRYPLSLRTGEVEPWGISAVQADQVSFAGGKKVCIIDSGYDLGHPDLQNNANVTGDSAGAGDWFFDGDTHGTHVAGTISAIGGNGKGVVGVLPNADVELHIVKVFDSNGGFVYSSGLVGALDECQAAGADVINMSLGGSFKSRTEDRAFASAESAGVLSIAAAGNDGNTRHSYPASYNSVVSVAALDEFLNLADFSQQTDQVELAGPGVHVLSTVTENQGSEAAATVAGLDYVGDAMDGSATGSAAGSLVDCGLGTTVCTNAAGKVCLIQRGDISFLEKVQACEDGGGVGTIIYNNEAGPLLGTLGEGETSSGPAIGVSQADGQAMLADIGQNASVSVEVSDYAFFDGTSMATPHVAGVAALVWSNAPQCSNVQIRDVLSRTALDLGPAGRDNGFGNGLVQAKAAIDEIAANGCGGGGNGGGGCKGGPKKCGN